MQTTFARHALEGDGGDAAPAPGRAGRGRRSARDAQAREPALRSRGSSGINADRNLVEALSNSKIFQDYERAFTEATGLPVALRAVESWQLPHHGHRNESPFCALVVETSRACASCLQVQERLAAGAVDEAHTVNCPAGLCDTAVPVRLGDRLIGFLQTGQLFRKAPSRKQFQRTLRLVSEWGVNADPRKLERAYFATRVVPNKKHEAVVRLLSIFAQHLSMLSNQVVLQQENAEPPVITRAKEYIQQHQTEHLRLGHVARAVNTSTFYFCKMFKQVTGINFTDYLSRVRIEKAKNLLLNPNLRVSEIAFEVGFQSLTHFNRVFKKILGQSPTEYRAQLLGTS
ncbi:MAG TPA: helix-turn-helix domain-containing protein [Candidatus Paceibacterota bacterium]|nr:helix-turn-helix domain-containing protein [Verrucomicrobiota bacterium]HSA11871.1 helix-turn-helix domain-containing protein [Candidatus Paceibacterota bacterium]